MPVTKLKLRELSRKLEQILNEEEAASQENIY